MLIEIQQFKQFMLLNEANYLARKVPSLDIDIKVQVMITGQINAALH